MCSSPRRHVRPTHAALEQGLAPAADWREVARAHAEIFGHVAPANTTLVVAGLIGDDFLVEVELEAELPA